MLTNGGKTWRGDRICPHDGDLEIDCLKCLRIQLVDLAGGDGSNA